jgi:hypothetical protein
VEGVDPRRSKNNVIFRLCRSGEEAFNEIFGPFVASYAYRDSWEKWKKEGSFPKELVIENYYRKIRNNRHGIHTFVELIIRIGKVEDYYTGPHGELDEKLFRSSRRVLSSYLILFLKRFWRFVPISVVIHLDEPSKPPHLHIVFIPAALYPEKQRVRCSLSRALEQTRMLQAGTDGEKCYRGRRKLALWALDQRKILEDLCINEGIEIRRRILYDSYEACMDEKIFQEKRRLHLCRIKEKREKIEALRKELKELRELKIQKERGGETGAKVNQPREKHEKGLDASEEERMKEANKEIKAGIPTETEDETEADIEADI